eukprot:5829608-Prymnesium_polylepis.1
MHRRGSTELRDLPKVPTATTFVYRRWDGLPMYAMAVRTARWRPAYPVSSQLQRHGLRGPLGLHSGALPL